MRPTTSTGSVMYSPYTANVPAVTSTDTTEKAMKLTGRPQKLPITTARRFPNDTRPHTIVIDTCCTCDATTAVAADGQRIGRTPTSSSRVSISAGSA